jgi:hypothetical protein
LSLGLENAGCRVVLAADDDAYAMRTHAANFQGLSEQMDLSNPEVEARLIELLKLVPIALVGYKKRHYLRRADRSFSTSSTDKSTHHPATRPRRNSPATRSSRHGRGVQ